MREAEWQAALERDKKRGEGAAANKGKDSDASDKRPLWMRLEEQRALEKEAMEREARKSKGVATLNEDDVKYLEEITQAKAKKDTEQRLLEEDMIKSAFSIVKKTKQKIPLTLSSTTTTNLKSSNQGIAKADAKRKALGIVLKRKE